MAKGRKFAVFIMLVWISVLLSNVSAAQYYNEDYYEDKEELRTFYGGLLLGANFTQVDGDFYAGFRKVGLNAGGIMYAKLGRRVAVSMELLFSQKGSRANKAQLQKINADSFLIEKYKIELNYAEVPIMISYFDKRKSHFGAGLSYSQLISSNETLTTIPAGNALGDVNKLYPFKKADVNAVVCFNLHLIGGFFLNYHYQYSLFSIRDKGNYPLARDNQYNNLHVLRIMYLF